MKQFIDWYRALTHDQRKQFATVCNTIAALIMVQLTFKNLELTWSWGKFLLASSGAALSFGLWYVSIIIVKQKDGE